MDHWPYLNRSPEEVTAVLTRAASDGSRAGCNGSHRGTINGASRAHLGFVALCSLAFA